MFGSKNKELPAAKLACRWCGDEFAPEVLRGHEGRHVTLLKDTRSPAGDAYRDQGDSRPQHTVIYSISALPRQRDSNIWYTAFFPEAIADIVSTLPPGARISYLPDEQGSGTVKDGTPGTFTTRFLLIAHF